MCKALCELQLLHYSRGGSRESTTVWGTTKSSEAINPLDNVPKVKKTCDTVDQNMSLYLYRFDVVDFRVDPKYTSWPLAILDTVLFMPSHACTTAIQYSEPEQSKRAPELSLFRASLAASDCASVLSHSRFAERLADCLRALETSESM